jgi:hypothetical protein
MIRIEINLVPGGFEPARRTIAVMLISNRSNLADKSDYRIEVAEADNRLTGTPARHARFDVVDHERRQVIWALLEKAAKGALNAVYDDFG